MRATSMRDLIKVLVTDVLLSLALIFLWTGFVKATSYFVPDSAVIWIRSITVTAVFLTMLVTLTVQVIDLTRMDRRETGTSAQQKVEILPASPLFYPTELEVWAAQSAAEGTRKVHEHLARLRDKGIIDAEGNLLVPLPPDMQPESKTDV